MTRSVPVTLIASLALITTAPAADLVPVDARLKDEALVAFTEGPVWHPSGNVYFSDIENNRIMRRDPAGVSHVYRVPSGRTNGNLFDLQGRLVCCEGGGPGGYRRVTRTEHNGTITVLADNYRGRKFNSPNDLAIDSKGRIYFTDPRYGDKGDMQITGADGKPVEGVYRIDAPGKVVQVIAREVARPNGIVVSADDRHLFVADNVNDGPHGEGGNRKLWRFDLNKDGTVDPQSRRLIFDWGTDRGPDGMALDTDGRLWVAAGFNFGKPPVETVKKYKAGIYVINPNDGDDAADTAGKLVEFIPVPIDMVTNCCFGGADLHTLYITAGHQLWSIPTNAKGFLHWPKDGETGE